MLDGLRVVDMTQYLAGPTVTRLLAEMGADIVKLERPPYGDPGRGLAIIKDGRSAWFVQQNRGKKSLCIDHDSPEGRKVLDALLAEADVFVENFGPGVLEKRGLDWASLRDKYPRLIMVSVSGYGRDSDYSDRVAFDLVAQAEAGIMYMTGEADGPPQPVGTSIGDVGAGVHATAALGFALYHRERTGRGQFLDISMVDSLFHMHEVNVQGPAMTGMRWKPTRAGHQSRINAPHGAYPGPDGWLAVHVMDRQWPGMCRAMQRVDLIEDERFATLATRQKNRHELNAIVEEWMASMPSDDAVLDALAAERVPSAKVRAPYDAIGHPHFESRGMIRRVPDPIIDEVIIPGSPLRFSEQPEPLDLMAPLLGEHNESVLASLGYSSDTIAALHDSGVLHLGDT